ncbi:MAG TPA: cytochrome P460 family protein [Candidatus Binatus sp.]|nr:cytochrome P460 family protein [Candidatus Binatus sp.]
MVRCLAAVLALTLGVAGMAAARPPRCSGARYVLSPGTPLATGSAIVIDERGFVTITGTCDAPKRAREWRARVGTRMTARWRQCTALGAVRLVGVIADGCTRLTGTLRVGRARLPFEAVLVLPEPSSTTTTTTTTTVTTTTETTTTTSTTTTLPGLPGDIAGYGSWLRMNAEPIPVHPVGDAHFGTKNVYVNQTRDAIAPGGVQQLPFPDGTILVKESTRPGRDFIGLVSIMRKRAGSDPAHGDWQWVEYARSSGQETFAEVERDAVCWTCHKIREPWDWVYTRLDGALP